MLVLSRKLDESIIIGEDFKVTILSIRGNQIRLGIDAPREVSVHRKEVHMRIKNDVENPRLDDPGLENPLLDDDAINDPQSEQH